MGFMNRAASAAVAACVLAMLAACGGGGGGGGSGGAGSGGGGGGTSSPYVLFASDFAGNIAAFTTLSPAAGTTVTANVVERVQYTGNSMAYDAARDELYLLYSNSFVTPDTQLEVFAHASTLKAGATPARTVVLSHLHGVEYMVLDTLHDRLWINGGDDDSQASMAVYDHASTLSGTAAPTRSLRVSTHTFAVDFGRDILYLTSFGNAIEVYDHASTLNGSVLVDREIRGMDNNDGLVLDPGHDTLYAMATSTGNIYAMHGVSTATSVTPSVITLPAGASLWSLALDAAHDRLYAGGQDAAYVIDHVSTLTAGAAAASKVEAPGIVVAAFAFAGQ